MSKKTLTQMEAVLMDRIEKARLRLQKLQQKQQSDIGAIAIKCGLQQYDYRDLYLGFKRLALELSDDPSPEQPRD